MKKTFADICLERAEKATPGPWKARLGCHIYSELNGYVICDLPKRFDRNQQNTEFISHARTDVPILALRLIEACHYLRTNGLGHLADALEKEPDERSLGEK